MAEQFNQKDSMGMFQFAMSTIGLFVMYINGTMLVNTKHITRFWITASTGVIALTLIALASYMGTSHPEASQFWFYLAIFASVLMGVNQIMGEVTGICFCNSFPKHVVGFVCGGSGCAGLTGSSSVLLLQSMGL